LYIYFFLNLLLYCIRILYIYIFFKLTFILHQNIVYIFFFKLTFILHQNIVFKYHFLTIDKDSTHSFIWYLRFYYTRWVDITAGVLLVPEGIIHPVITVSALTWFIRYIYYWNLQLLNNVIIIKTKVLLPQT
jgi:hypothetical protein